MLGDLFEREIRDQPAVWDRIAQSGSAQQLADAIAGRSVVLIGSGSSLFVSQLGALALRRRGIDAHALAATESFLDHAAYRQCAVIAVSQSGRSADILAALDILEPRMLIAVTNTSEAPLCERATVCIDVGAGTERAVPASKSVSATAAILLWAAGLMAGTSQRSAATLRRTADAVQRWLGGPGVEALREAAHAIAKQQSVVVVGSGYGAPVASEFALKLKEASYIHAEGFAAGEFRHGSAAILDSSRALIGIVDEVSHAVVNRPLQEATQAATIRYVIGGELEGIVRIGPLVDPPFNTLAWLVAAQMTALYVGRARGVDSDTPRGLSKYMG